MVKADLAQAIYEKLKTEVSRAEANTLLNEIFDEIKKTLTAGENLLISGFGGFKVVKKASRTGRNPKTGQPLPIPARRVVKLIAYGFFRTFLDGKQRWSPICWKSQNHQQKEDHHGGGYT